MFLPEAAYTSRTLAEHIHLNMQGKSKCRYHKKTKNYNWYDGRIGAPHLVYGSPYQYVPGKDETPARGCMHCRCPIDEVLFDFYFWKTWTATSKHDNYFGRDEGMGDGYLVPHNRTFVVQAFMKQTFLKIDDIYSSDHGRVTHRRRIMALQAQRLVERLNFLLSDKYSECQYSLVLPNINLDDLDDDPSV